jgi:PAS domain S-box-containing protein
MGSAEEPSVTPSLTTLFTSLAEESADSIVVVFDDGNIRYMNPMAGAVTGRDPSESQGLSIFELVHPDDVDRAIFDLGVHSEPGAPPGWSTYRVRSADGSWLPMQVTTAEVSDGSSRLLATFCRAADVSPTEALFGLLRGTSPGRRADTRARHVQPEGLRFAGRDRLVRRRRPPPCRHRSPG